ncbi:MAG: PEGA domain-containing protein, partial [Candidatus Zixiibacteriota bacterium]
MIECGKCGTANHFDGAMFCKNCGAELSSRVAVKVADEPTRVHDKTQPIVTQSDTKEEQSETDFVVTDLPIDEIDAKASDSEQPPGGGFDQLLKRFESDQAVKALPEDAIEPARLSSELGIESPTDYLMREQQEAPENASEIPLPMVGPEVASEVSAERTRPMNETKSLSGIDTHEKRATDQVVSDDDRDRLLNSLQKTLAEEDAASAPQNQLHLDIQQTQTVSRSVEVEVANVVESPPGLETVEVGAAFRSTQTHPQQAVFIKGHRLLFPEKAHLVPGEMITYGNQQYMIKKGSIDRKQLIIGGALGLIVIAVLLIIGFSGATVPKPALYGVVTSAETKEVLAGISVSIPQTGASTVTDEAGMFTFPGLPDGRYDVKMEGTFYEAQMMPTSIINGESKMVHGTLSPLLSQMTSFATTAPRSTNESVVNTGPIFGTLKVKCSISDAMVLVDGKAIGSANQTFKRMMPGTHTVVVTRDGYENWEQQVRIDEEETTTLTVNLTEAKAAGPVEYSADDFFQQAEALLAEKNYTEAIGYYTLALAKDNTLVQAYLRRAEANEASNKTMNARADFRSAADLYLHSNRFADAITCYDKIIEMAPNAFDAYQLRGWAKISSGKYDSGLKDLEKALSFNKDDTQSQFEYGKALYITNNYKESEKILKKIRKYGDDSPEIYAYLALTYLAQGSESDA